MLDHISNHGMLGERRLSRKHTCKDGVSWAPWMGCYLENRMERLKKSRFIGGVITNGKVYHCEIDRLELSGLNTHQKLTDFGVRSITSDDEVTCVGGAIPKSCSNAALGTLTQLQECLFKLCTGATLSEELQSTSISAI